MVGRPVGCSRAPYSRAEYAPLGESRTSSARLSAEVPGVEVGGIKVLLDSTLSTSGLVVAMSGGIGTVVLVNSGSTVSEGASDGTTEGVVGDEHPASATPNMIVQQIFRCAISALFEPPNGSHQLRGG